MYDKFDSSLVGISYTNEKGRFVFNQLKTSIYFLKFTSFGYSPLYLNDINLNKNVVLPKITFYSSEAKTFDEIQIVEKVDEEAPISDEKVDDQQLDEVQKTSDVEPTVEETQDVEKDQEEAATDAIFPQKFLKLNKFFEDLKNGTDLFETVR